MTAQEIIDKLGLEPLPEEGGFFKVTYRDNRTLPSDALPHHDGNRQYCSSIYYLITPEEFSGLHAVLSTETFHFYAGDPVCMIQIDETGDLTEHIISSDLAAGHQPQITVAPNIWQGTKLIKGGSWALLGCTVTPAFEYQDFINGTYEELSKKFPDHKKRIEEYTHK